MDTEGEAKVRRFRKDESYEAERVTRDMLSGFLSRQGFRVISDARVRNGQTIIAVTPNGEHITMRVRLCWRRQSGSRDSTRVRTYSAAQFLAKVENDDWEGTIREKIERERALGITHILLVQSDDDSIVYAAQVPLSAVLPIWVAQHHISDELIRQGQLGRRKKNHAMNGSSPTLWLQDDHAPRVAAALWEYPGVHDLSKHEHVASVGLHDEEGDQTNPPDNPSYSPQEGDLRRLVERQIRERRGQQQFRDILRERYGNRCMITGCEVLAILEAAHIKPYRGENDNHPENGLLLRADIHTLFDLDMLAIEPDRLHVVLHPDVAKEEDYRHLDLKVLGCMRDPGPSREALRARYEQFRRRLHQSAGKR